MIVVENKTSFNSISDLHRHLYDMENENYELLNLYESINCEVSEFEKEQTGITEKKEELKSELNELKNEINTLIKDKDILSKEEFIEELKRIMF